MDPISRAKGQRAARLIQEVVGTDGPTLEAKAQAFIDAAFAVMKAADIEAMRDNLCRHENPIVSKAAQGASTLSNWGDSAGAEQVQAYLGTIASRSIVDAVLPHAKRPPNVRKVMVASGVAAGAVVEGAPKAVRRLGLGLDEMTSLKVAAIVAMTQETIDAGGEAIFKRELTDAVVEGSNTAFIGGLGSTTAVAATGDPLEDLQAGLMASDASEHYVVVADHGLAAAMRVDSRISQDGIAIVAHQGQSGLLIIPSSRLAIVDLGLRVKGAGHASIDMADDPQSPAELVSLWQTNSRALLVEREFRLLLDGDSSSAGAVLVS